MNAPASLLERCCSIVAGLLPAARAAEPVAPDGPLRALGFDSMRFLTLIAQVEQQFDIVVEPGDMEAENFETPRRIERFVQACLRRGGGAAG